MAYVATKQPYMLMVLFDEDAQNPREDYDYFGTMVCWHNRYNLGDKHDSSEPNDFLKELVLSTLSHDDIINHIKLGQVSDTKLEYNRLAKGWEVLNYDEQSKKWYTDFFYKGNLETNKEVLANDILEAMKNQVLLEMAEKANVVLPLHLYDHSGITMSTTSFSCRWDSGQVGWIYASHKEIEQEYEIVTPLTIEKAKELLRSEVKTYDSYLTGENYGFKLFKNGKEDDSCWGFLGSIDDIKSTIAEYLPDGCKTLVNELEYIDENEYEEEYEEMEIV